MLPVWLWLPQSHPLFWCDVVCSTWPILRRCWIFPRQEDQECRSWLATKEQGIYVLGFWGWKGIISGLCSLQCLWTLQANFSGSTRLQTFCLHSLSLWWLTTPSSWKYLPPIPVAHSHSLHEDGIVSMLWAGPGRNRTFNKSCSGCWMWGYMPVVPTRGRGRSLGQAHRHSEWESRLCYVRSCLKTNK